MIRQQVTREWAQNILRRGGENDRIATVFLLGALSNRVSRAGERILLRAMEHQSAAYDKDTGYVDDPADDRRPHSHRVSGPRTP